MPLCLYFGHFGHLISPFISDGEIHLDTPFSRLLGKPPIMVKGTSYVDNALRRILVPQAGQKVVVKYAGSLPLLVTVYGTARS